MASAITYPTRAGLSAGLAAPFGRADCLSPASALAGLPQRVIQRGPGSELFAQDDPCRYIFQLRQGSARAYRLFEDGRRQIVGFYFAGDLFGFEGADTCFTFAETVTEASLRVWDVTQGGLPAEAMLPLAAASLRRAQRHMLVLGRQNALERVSLFLLELAEHQGGAGTLDLPMSRADLANHLGLTLETLSRLVSRLRDKGVIAFKGLRHGRIADAETLRQYAGLVCASDSESQVEIRLPKES
ncbi:MAG: helix-turn-helix domain-containing protein [Methylobacterium mesophilicum]|nr:helix-turn-helix domain-containing protein [Methylobacterium mesophilicum]